MYERGLEDREGVNWIPYLTGQIDHETGGTWDENVKGDYGCSVGLPQIYTCKGGYPELANHPQLYDYDWQIEWYLDRMERFIDLYGDDIEKVISAHNAPGWAAAGLINRSYVKRVKASAQLFN